MSVEHLHVEQVRAMMTLIADLSAMPNDFESRAAALLNGICRMVDSRGGCICGFDLSRPARSRIPSWIIWKHIAADQAVVARLTEAAGRRWKPPGVVCPERSVGATGAPSDRYHYALRTCPRTVVGVAIASDGATLRATAGAHGSALLAELLSSPWVPRCPTLSEVKIAPRPATILGLLRRGHSEKEVANALGISVHTVHHHVKTLYRSFGVNSRAELLSLWIGDGILRFPRTVSRGAR